MNLSLTWSSAVIFCLLWGAQVTGISLTEGELQGTIVVIGKILAMSGIFYGRWRQGDLKNILGAKK